LAHLARRLKPAPHGAGLRWLWGAVRGEALARLGARLRDAMVRGERVALVITSDLASVVYRSTVVADWVPLLDPAPLDRSTLDHMELIRGEGDPVALFDSWA